MQGSAGGDDEDKQLPSNAKTVSGTMKEVEEQASAVFDKLQEENRQTIGKPVVCGAPLSRREETADTILEPHDAEGHHERQAEKWADLRRRRQPLRTASVVGRHGVDWYTYRRNVLKPAVDNICARLPNIPDDLTSFVRERHGVVVLVVLVPMALYDDPECLCLTSLIGSAAFPSLGHIEAEVWPDDEEYREKLGVPLKDEISRIKV